MRLLLTILGLCVPLWLAGCGSATTATITGKIVDNGQPRQYQPTQAAVQLTLVGPGGKLDENRSFTAVVNPDGTFQVISSGGEIPVGTYQVAIQIRDEDPKYKAFAAPESQVRREIKPGRNELVLDLSKPAG